MKIEHIAMYVNDLEKAKDFFTGYFNGRANAGYHNKTTGFRSYVISFNQGARLEIRKKPDVLDSEKPPARTGYAHIAFSAGSKEAVGSRTEKLMQEGFKVESGPRTTGDGYYESCIVAIEDNRIEITV